MTRIFELETLVRENIKSLTPYSSARDEFTSAGDGQNRVMLDANESPYESGVNRYPDPYQRKVKDKIGEIKNIDPGNIFLGNGSDEAIDLLIRIFCEPGEDRIMLTPPTYGMYKVSAGVNNIETIEVELDNNFQLDLLSMKAKFQEVKMIFLCSPVNPTGNLIRRSDIHFILENFNGIVVVDEAYIDFCSEESTLIRELSVYPNLVVTQTLSKAWGMAGLRLGMAFASKDIIQFLNRVKPPYNINTLTQAKVLEVLENSQVKTDHVDQILIERDSLIIKLDKLSMVKKVFHSDSNFLLVRFIDSATVFDHLKDKNVIIRDRSRLPGCENCLRITIGLPEENSELINQLKKLENG